MVLARKPHNIPFDVAHDGSVATIGLYDGVHLFDFDEDIDGKYIRVDFIARLRNEIKFDEVKDLVE